MAKSTVDDQGTKIAEKRYLPWGGVRDATGDLHTDKTYTGQRTYTDNFGLMYYNARCGLILITGHGAP